MISFRNVTKSFPGSARPAVDDLTLEIDQGETVVLVGPSGCGKTTTMKMVNRLVEPSSGSVLVNGVDVMTQDPVELRRGIGYVIQSVGLLPHRTVRQNIATVLQLLRWDAAAIRRRVDELADMLELDRELLERYPVALSGGQRQRVGVARALAADPPVMLMDEPFGAVDPVVRQRLQDEFLDIQQRLKKTILFVTHDVDEAIKMADRIAILNTGAAVEQYATPEEILRKPANDFVDEFVGGERGLKRLALVPVAALEAERGPVVARDMSAAQARSEMEAFRCDWASVVEDGALLGWIDRAALDGIARVADARPKPFGAHVSPESSLRQALDSIVTSQTKVAVVVDEEGRYRGILSLETISREIVS